MKKLFFALLGLCSLNISVADVTNGALQQNPALCSYGYNPNCNQNNASRPPKKVIITTIIHHPDKYGAYALNKKTGIGGGAIEMNSKAEAERSAIKKCENGGKNSPCQIVMQVRNGCMAIAKSTQREKLKLFYSAEKPGLAEKFALNKCSTAGFSNCEIALSEVCSVPEGMYN